jgi:pimeloyl-ACP methyl ester carboxylesterase
MGVARLRSVVFASSVTPYMLTTKDNPDGPLSKKQAAQMAASLTANQGTFYEQFVNELFSVDGALQVSEEQRQGALAMCHQANKVAALACLSAFGSTDFREDVPKATVPSLVIHGDADETVPSPGRVSGRTRRFPTVDFISSPVAHTVSMSAMPMNSTTH